MTSIQTSSQVWTSGFECQSPQHFSEIVYLFSLHPSLETFCTFLLSFQIPCSWSKYSFGLWTVLSFKLFHWNISESFNSIFTESFSGFCSLVLLHANRLWSQADNHLLLCLEQKDASSASTNSYVYCVLNKVMKAVVGTKSFLVLQEQLLMISVICQIQMIWRIVFFDNVLFYDGNVHYQDFILCPEPRNNKHCISRILEVTSVACTVRWRKLCEIQLHVNVCSNLYVWYYTMLKTPQHIGYWADIRAASRLVSIQLVHYNTVTIR